MRLALFQPDIPQNLGAAIRLGACLGAEIDVIEPCGFPLSNPALKRTALDYGPLAKVQRHSSWSSFLAEAARNEGRLVLFTTQSAVPFQTFDFSAGDTLLFGRESAGAPPEVHEAAQARLYIPLQNGARSLNLVTAAAMALCLATERTGSWAA